jgi:hypothetical protein
LSTAIVLGRRRLCKPEVVDDGAERTSHGLARRNVAFVAQDNEKAELLRVAGLAYVAAEAFGRGDDVTDALRTPWRRRG